MNIQNKCPHCGAIKAEPLWSEDNKSNPWYSCGTLGVERSLLCREREARWRAEEKLTDLLDTLKATYEVSDTIANLFREKEAETQRLVELCGKTIGFLHLCDTESGHPYLRPMADTILTELNQLTK
jgi:hypothetical protein